MVPAAESPPWPPTPDNRLLCSPWSRSELTRRDHTKQRDEIGPRDYRLTLSSVKALCQLTNTPIQRRIIRLSIDTFKHAIILRFAGRSDCAAGLSDLLTSRAQRAACGPGSRDLVRAGRSRRRAAPVSCQTGAAAGRHGSWPPASAPGVCRQGAAARQRARLAAARTGRPARRRPHRPARRLAPVMSTQTIKQTPGCGRFNAPVN